MRQSTRNYATSLIYDTIANTGTVVVGVSYDTPEFAVESIGLWLTSYGLNNAYPVVEQLEIEEGLRRILPVSKCSASISND